MFRRHQSWRFPCEYLRGWKNLRPDNTLRTQPMGAQLDIQTSQGHVLLCRGLRKLLLRILNLSGLCSSSWPHYCCSGQVVFQCRETSCVPPTTGNLNGTHLNDIATAPGMPSILSTLRSGFPKLPWRALGLSYLGLCLYKTYKRRAGLFGAGEDLSWSSTSLNPQSLNAHWTHDSPNIQP